MPMNYSGYAIPRADLGEAFHEFSPDGQTFIAEQIFPVRGVIKKAAALSVITRKNLKRSDTKHANGSAYGRINLDAKDMDYKCASEGLEIPVTDEDRENFARDFDCEMESIQVLKLKMLLERECRVKDLVFDTSTWTGSDLYTDVSGSAPFGTVGSEVIPVITTAKEKVRKQTGVTPNALILGQAALNQLLGNTKIIARFPGNPGPITEDMLRNALAQIFGLQQLIVGSAVYDSAKEGQDFSSYDIWGDMYAMVAKIQSGPTSINAGLGRSIIWTPLDAGEESIVQYREEQTASDIFRSQGFRQEKVFDQAFAHLLKINLA